MKPGSFLKNRFFSYFDDLSSTFCSLHAGHLERSPEDEEYTLNFEESVISSHTATDDEIDFRMILPSESHRRKSLGRTGRSSSVGSDLGTVSFSSVRCQIPECLLIRSMNYKRWRSTLAQVVEHRATMRDMLSSSPAGPTLRVAK